MNIMDLNSHTVTIEKEQSRPDGYSVTVDAIGCVGVIKAKKGEIDPARLEEEILENMSQDNLQALMHTPNSLYEVSVRYDPANKKILVKARGKVHGYERVWHWVDIGRMHAFMSEWNSLTEKIVDMPIVVTSLKFNKCILCENGPLIVSNKHDSLYAREEDVVHCFDDKGYRLYKIADNRLEKVKTEPSLPNWAEEYTLGNNNCVLPQYPERLREAVRRYGNKDPQYEGKNLFVTSEKDIWVRMSGGWIPLGKNQSYLSSVSALGEDYLQEYFIYRATVE